MKKTYGILVITLLITTLAACKKNKDDQRSKNDLISTWELEELSTSWVPKQTYEPGNGNLLSINNDETYACYKDGQVTEQGNYSVAADDSVELNVCLVGLKENYKTRIDRSNVSVQPNQYSIFSSYAKTYFYIANNKLYMISGCYAVDGGGAKVYRRANSIPVD